MIARTHVVPAWIHSSRDEWVDQGADAAGGGLDESLPDYQGVWIDPEHGKPWHLFSDYSVDHHLRFGWKLI